MGDLLGSFVATHMGDMGNYSQRIIIYAHVRLSFGDCARFRQIYHLLSDSACYHRYTYCCCSYIYSVYPVKLISSTVFASADFDEFACSHYVSVARLLTCLHYIGFIRNSACIEHRNDSSLSQRPLIATFCTNNSILP